jgi:hypothetical protein
VFWIAANVSPNDAVFEFLSTILENLREEPNATEAEREALRSMLTFRFTQFAAPRIRKERAMLVRVARSCQSFLVANIDDLTTPGKTESSK